MGVGEESKGVRTKERRESGKRLCSVCVCLYVCFCVYLCLCVRLCALSITALWDSLIVMDVKFQETEFTANKTEKKLWNVCSGFAFVFNIITVICFSKKKKFCFPLFYDSYCCSVWWWQDVNLTLCPLSTSRLMLFHTVHSSHCQQL